MVGVVGVTCPPAWPSRSGPDGSRGGLPCCPLKSISFKENGQIREGKILPGILPACVSAGCWHFPAGICGARSRWRGDLLIVHWALGFLEARAGGEGRPELEESKAWGRGRQACALHAGRWREEGWVGRMGMGSGMDRGQ